MPERKHFFREVFPNSQRAFKPVLSKQLAGCNNLGQADPRVRVAMGRRRRRRRGRWIRDCSAGGFITHLAP